MYEPTNEQSDVPADTPPSYVKTMQGIWLFLLIPWMPFAGLSGMAFDGGAKTSAYIFTCAVWTYPPALLVAWMLRRRVPEAIFLPFANILLSLISGTS